MRPSDSERDRSISESEDESRTVNGPLVPTAEGRFSSHFEPASVVEFARCEMTRSTSAQLATTLFWLCLSVAVGAQDALTRAKWFVRVRRLRGGARSPRQGAVPGRSRCRHRAYGIPHPLSLRAQADRPGPHRDRYAPLEPSTISPRPFVDVSGRARAIRGDSDRPHPPPVQRGQGKLRCRGVPRRTGEVRSRDRAARGRQAIHRRSETCECWRLGTAISRR